MNGKWRGVDYGHVFHYSGRGDDSEIYEFCEPVISTTLRIKPIKWNSWPSLRFEAYF